MQIIYNCDLIIYISIIFWVPTELNSTEILK